MIFNNFKENMGYCIVLSLNILDFTILLIVFNNFKENMGYYIVLSPL